MPESLSRREFLKKFTGGKNPLNNPPPQEVVELSLQDAVEPKSIETETNQEFKTKMSRRTFLEFLVGASFVVTLPELFPKSDQDKTKTEEKDGVGPVERFNRSVDWQKFDQELSKDSSYTEAIVGQMLVRVASEIGERILHDFKIKTGNMSLSNKDVQHMLEKAPIESYVRTVVVGPFIEELIFRLIPSAFADRYSSRKDIIWELGVPLSAVFAWMHNIEDIKDEDGKTTIELHLDSIPLNQFLSGLFFWYLMRQKGFNHAALAHMFNNNASYMLAKIFDNHLPWDSKKGADS